MANYLHFTDLIDSDAYARSLAMGRRLLPPP